MKSILLAASAAVALFGATASEAATRLYTISNGAFSDGSTFSGSFSYDDATNAYSLGSISVTAGLLTAFTYSAANSSVYNDALGSNSVEFFASSAGRYFNLAFASSLADSTGAVAIRSGTGARAPSYECNNCRPFRTVTGGTVSATAAVPEPATWAMMIAGFGLVGGAMRRRSTKIAFT